MSTFSSSLSGTRMSPTHHRLSTRLVRHLRDSGSVVAESALIEQALAASQVPAGNWSKGLINSLLDGRFQRQGDQVGLWEWEYSFPVAGEAIVVLDIETTGLSPELHEVTELAMVRLEQGQRSVFQQLVNPGTSIPSFITRLTGIRNSDVADAPDIYAVLEQAWPMLQGSTLVIQNASFDLGFLKPRLRRMGFKLDNPVVDTIDWARRALPGLNKRGLDALAWAFDLGPIEGRHRALGDVETTLRVAHEMYYMLTAGTPSPARSLLRSGLLGSSISLERI